MNGKKPMMILIVIVIVVLLGYILPMVFSFEPNKHNTKNYQQIDDQYINVLYSYLPTDNYSNAYGNYNGYYTGKNNLSRTTMMGMVYNYIVNSDRFKLIALDEGESSDTALYKISITDLKKAYHTVFYEDDFHVVEFEYNDIKGIIKNDYMYIYKNEKAEKYVNYKEIDSYALAKDGDEIIIYEYYSKCDKTNNICYKDDNTTIVNNKFNSTNIDKDKLAFYKHTFKFDDSSYYWYSSEVVDDK